MTKKTTFQFVSLFLLFVLIVELIPYKARGQFWWGSEFWENLHRELPVFKISDSQVLQDLRSRGLYQLGSFETPVRYNNPIAPSADTVSVLGVVFKKTLTTTTPTILLELIEIQRTMQVKYKNPQNVEVSVTPRIITEVYDLGVSKPEKVFSQDFSDTNSVIRPLNDDILYLSQPECQKKKKKSLFRTKVSVTCDTRGISADGRLGQAIYHKSKSSFGGYLGGILIGVLSIAIPFLAPVLIPVGVIVATAITVPIASLIIANLTNPILHAVSTPGAMGTVATSNSLRVGGWKWWGGFTQQPPQQPPEQPTIDFKTPSPVELPQPINLAWATENADSLMASGDWSGSKQAGTYPYKTEQLFKPRGNYTFTLTATGPAGIASETRNVRVIQVPRCSFIANPTSIIPPASSTLSWSCQYADSCSIDQGIGSVNNVSGTKGVRPIQTTDYTLTCGGLDDSRSYYATVNVGFTPKLREVIPR